MYVSPSLLCLSGESGDTLAELNVTRIITTKQVSAHQSFFDGMTSLSNHMTYVKGLLRQACLISFDVCVGGYTSIK